MHLRRSCDRKTKHSPQTYAYKQCGTHLDDSNQNTRRQKRCFAFIRSGWSSSTGSVDVTSFRCPYMTESKLLPCNLLLKTHSRVKACDLSRQKQTPGEQNLMCVKVHVTCSRGECLWKGKAFVRPTKHWWYSEKHERTGKTVENYGGQKLHKSKQLSKWPVG